jgi:hypothetical protein
MKLSVEAKVAAAVAAGFIALTAAEIGQGGAEAQSNGPNYYSPTVRSGLNTQTTWQASESSLPDESAADRMENVFSHVNRVQP